MENIDQILSMMDDNYHKIGSFVRDEIPDLSLDWSRVGHTVHQEICDNEDRMRSSLSKVDVPRDHIAKCIKALYKLESPYQNDPVAVLQNTILQIYLCLIFPRDTLFRSISCKWRPKLCAIHLFCEYLYESDNAKSLRHGFSHGVFWFDDKMTFHFSRRSHDKEGKNPIRFSLDRNQIQPIIDLSRLILTSIGIWIDTKRQTLSNKSMHRMCKHAGNPIVSVDTRCQNQKLLMRK